MSRLLSKATPVYSCLIHKEQKKLIVILIKVKYFPFQAVILKKDDSDMDFQLLNLKFLNLYNFAPIYNIRRKDKYGEVSIMN